MCFLKCVHKLMLGKRETVEFELYFFFQDKRKGSKLYYCVISSLVPFVADSVVQFLIEREREIDGEKEGRNEGWKESTKEVGTGKKGVSTKVKKVIKE